MKNLLLLLFLLSTASLCAQWQSTNGPTGGTFWRLASNDDYIFIQTYGGMFRSADPETLGWERLDGIPVCENRWGMSTVGKDTIGVMIRFDTFTQIWISHDNGDTWPVKIDLPLNAGPDLDRFFLTAHNILLSGWQHKIISTDGGQSWQTIAAQALAPASDLQYFDGIFYLPKSYGYYTSVDEGITWQPHTISACSGDPKVIGAKGNMLLVRDYDGCFKRSLDGGQTWPNNNFNIANSYGEDAAILDGKMALLLSSSIVVSVDSGTTWTEYTLHEYGFQYGAPAVTFKGRFYFGTGGRGCWKFEGNPLTGTPVNKGLPFTQVIRLLEREGSLLACTPDAGIFSTALTNPLGWAPTPISSFGTAYPKLENLIQTDDFLFSTKGYQGLYRSGNEGISWQSVVPDDNWTPFSGDAVLFRHQDAIYLAETAYDGIWRSLDQGNTWEDIAPAPPSIFGPSHYHHYVSAGDTLFVGTKNLADNALHLFWSADNGNVWGETNAPVDSGVDYFHQLFAADGRLFALTSGWTDPTRLYSSPDRGQTWVESMAGLPVGPDGTLYVTSIIGANGVLLATLQFDGVFVSTDGGSSWQDFNDGLDCETGANQIFLAGQQLYLATEKRGVLQRSLNDLQMLSTASPPLHPAALQASPNPATPHQPIHFIFPEKTNTPGRLLFSDASGRVLKEALLPANTAETTLTISFPPGLYLVQWQTGSRYAVTKLLLL